MIDLEFLEALVRLLDESSLDRLEIDREGTRIRLAKFPRRSGAGGASQVVAALPAMAPPGPHPGATDPAAPC